MYQGHLSDGSSVQRHSAGPLYPAVIGVRERRGVRQWFVIYPGRDDHYAATYDDAVAWAQARNEERARRPQNQQRPTIQRLSRDEFLRGWFGVRRGFIAIRISDVCGEFQPCAHPSMGEEHRFSFEDVDQQGQIGWEGRIDSRQGQEIAAILRRAREQGRDVVVHCNHGVYRSGAVCAAAADQHGFNYLNPHPYVNTEVYRSVRYAQQNASTS